MARPPIAITMGEPAGIGGEITIKAWKNRAKSALPPFFLIDDVSRLRDLADRLGIRLPIASISEPGETLECFEEALPVLPSSVPLAAPCQPGLIEGKNAESVIAAIDLAVEFFWQEQVAAIVTNPIHKSALYEAGFTHPGHTEYLAELCHKRTGKNDRPVMMLAVDGLRAVPATIHMALRDVPAALSKDLIIEVARTTAKALESDFAMPNPRLAICGLNPHAGEDGALGDEEVTRILPAIEALKAEGHLVTGPHSADTLFHPEARMHYDAVIAMYHDQALIPIKTLDFHKGVNITLGLPLIRTSPDHGTALDLAGSGQASPASLIEAIHTARFIADIHAKAKAS